MSSEMLEEILIGALLDNNSREGVVNAEAVTIDFSSPIWSRFVSILGDFNYYEIKKYSDIGIPRPESTKSDQGLIVSIKAGGSVWIALQVPPLAYRDVVGYVIAYALDSDLEMNCGWNLGGVEALSRNQFSKNFKLPKGSWGRLFNNWFVEFHHGTVWFVIRVVNTSAYDARLVVGLIQVSSIKIDESAVFRLKGWENVYKLELSNESYTESFHVVVPRSYPILNLACQVTVVPSTGSSANVAVYLDPGGKQLAKVQNITSQQTVYVVLSVKSTPPDINMFENFVVRVEVDASGTVTITSLLVGIQGIEQPRRFSKRARIVQSGTGYATLIAHDRNYRIIALFGRVTNTGSNSLDIVCKDTVETRTILTLEAGESINVNLFVECDEIGVPDGINYSLDMDLVVVEELGEIP